MSAGDHERWREDLPAYALGALDEARARAVADHLAGCERCRAELDWLEPAVHALPATVEQRRAPAAMRGRVLSVVRREARRREAPADGRRARRLRPAVAVAVVAGLVAAGIAGYAVRGPETEGASSALQASADAPTGSSGELTRYDGSATLELRGLPAARDGDVYQAWIRDGRTIAPSTVFVPAHDGTAAAAIPDLGDGDEVMITLEPHGGSVRPSSAPIFSVRLS